MADPTVIKCSKCYIYKPRLCYRPSVISITVTTGGHLRGSGLYKTSGTMGRGVAESRS